MSSYEIDMLISFMINFVTKSCFFIYYDGSLVMWNVNCRILNEVSLLKGNNVVIVDKGNWVDVELKFWNERDEWSLLSIVVS